MRIPPRCDYAGYEREMSWCGSFHEPECEMPATHRYRGSGFVDGHWSHRCAQHVRILSAPGLVIEPLAGDPS